jgi:LGFP repeat
MNPVASSSAVSTVNKTISRVQQNGIPAGPPKLVRPLEPPSPMVPPVKPVESGTDHAPKPPVELVNPAIFIEAKAKSLGALPGSATGPVVPVAGGYMQSFQGCDIFYSGPSRTHEVHGDIRVKYMEYLGGPAGVLGFPTTDETGTPDGVGRYNHFTGGSIYWSPSTGPMMVRGPIQDVWAGQGWEAGGLRYPVADPYTMYAANSAVKPTTSWSLFENGAILASNDGAAIALTAEVAPDALRGLVRRQFDQQVHLSPDNVGLQPQVETLGISDWTYSLSRSGGRKITIRLHGFHDNGLAPDTNFTADIQLGFDLVWPDQFAEPTQKTLVAGLFSVTVQADGLGSQSVADGVKNGIWGAFYPANADPLKPYIRQGWRAITTIDTGAQQDGASIDVIGILVTQDGGLQVLLNPLPAGIGALRQRKAQAVIDDLILGV